MTVDVKQAQDLLSTHGFPCGAIDGKIGPATRSAVRRFQTAFAGGREDLPLLQPDGELGPRTEAALKQLPYLSPHFQVGELRSKGDRTCYVRRELLVGLEVLRERYARPIVLRSGFRDPAHNKKVGGAKHSMHMYGYAADVALDWTWQQVAELGIFSGLGFRQSDKTVRHVDVRHLAPANKTPDARPDRPQTWAYPT